MVKVPEAWLKQQDIHGVVADAVGKVFRQSQRLVGVILLWEEWHRASEGWKVESRFKNYPNKNSRLYQSDIDDLVTVIGRASNPSWVSFHAFIEQTRPSR